MKRKNNLVIAALCIVAYGLGAGHPKAYSEGTAFAHKPIAIAIEPGGIGASVLGQGSGSIIEIKGARVTNILDITKAAIPASPCVAETPGGRCLTDIAINPVTGQTYAPTWYADIAHIVSSRGLDWVFCGQGPSAVVSSLNDASIYVADQWLHEAPSGISVIDGHEFLCPDADPECTVTVPLTGCRPQVGVSTRDGLVYFCCQDANTVVVLSRTLVLAEIAVDAYPNGIAENDGRIYAVCSGESPATVAIIEGTELVDTVPIGQSATDTLGIDPFWGVLREGSTKFVAPGPNGDVYVANWHSGSVSVIDPAGDVQHIGVGRNPNAVTSDDDYVYVANVADDTVSVLHDRHVVRTIPVGDHPIALEHNPVTDLVYCVNRDDDSVTLLAHGAFSTTLHLPETITATVHLPLCVGG